MLHRSHRPLVRSLLLASLALATAGLTTTPALALQSGTSDGAGQNSKETQREQKDRERAEKEQAKERAKRLEKLDKSDRAAVDSTLDYAMPTWTAGLDWVGGAKAPSLDDLRGRVVVLQTFTTKNAPSRAALERLAKALGEFKPEDIRLIAIHTPEGADRAATQLEKASYTFPVAIDRDGAYCDSIGAFRKPVNLVINRTGDVKFTGLTVDGVVASVTELVAEPFDPASKANLRKPETSKPPKEFPSFRTAISSAQDLRGKPAPSMGNVNWWNGSPNIQGKLVVVDFWATWCKPCKDAIPHMNDLAKSFRADVQCMGISDEANSKFERGLKDSRLDKGDFAYPVGVDPNATMKRGFGITGIPHVAIISSDGIVRWQGHPSELNGDLMRQLIEANRALLAHRGDADMARWKQTLDREKDDSGSRSR